MTREERKNPDMLKASRKKRIAAGSGTKVEDVNKLLKMHRNMADMMKAVGRGKGGPMAGLAKAMGFGGGLPSAEEIKAMQEKVQGGELPELPEGTAVQPARWPAQHPRPHRDERQADAARPRRLPVREEEMSRRVLTS
ncbi:MAG: hypothetical protein MZV49_03795 [Rhodopseudomonas palustris]|nr:hypothetical protein [Rhodopseudomonas palustris]